MIAPEIAVVQFRVVTVKPNGTHIIAGTCPTREAAESWAELITKYGRLVGSSAHVEEVREGQS